MSRDKVKIIFGGDAMFGRSFNNILKISNLKSVYGDMYQTLKGVDGVLVNLETTITKSNKKYQKVFNFKLDPKFKGVLKEGNIKYVSLANNHICDFREEGMNDTIKNLNSLNIKYSGAGENPHKEAILRLKNVNLAILSAADHYWYWNSNINLNSKHNTNLQEILRCIWFINLKDHNQKQKVYDRVKKLKEKTDIDHVIFSLHINKNKVDNIEKLYVDFCRGLIESGVSIIYCHSPHHVLPYEKYKKGYIFYSLGSFIDDYYVDEYRDDLSILPQFSLTKTNIKLDIIHKIKISNMTMNRCTDDYELSLINKNLRYFNANINNKITDFMFSIDPKRKAEIFSLKKGGKLSQKKIKKKYSKRYILTKKYK